MPESPAQQFLAARRRRPAPRLRLAAVGAGVTLLMSLAAPLAVADSGAGGSQSLAEIMAAADAAHANDRPPARPDDTEFAQAKASGKNVPIGRLTTEYSETVATPNGELQETRHPDQQRLQAGGAWAALDATLTARPGGGYAPKATPSGVTLSSGGTGPLATLTSADGKKLAIDAPFALPAPQVAGDNLLYPAVLGADTDLQVIVGKTGSVSTVLIVKTAAAAANPALQTLHFGTTTVGITVASDSDHNLTATATDGTLRWHAPAPRMWDSTPASSTPNTTPAPSASTPAAKSAQQAAGTDAQSAAEPPVPTATTSAPGTAPTPTAAPPGTKAPGPVVSSADGPGTDAKIATMPVATTPTGIDLTPDRTVLATGTAPFFIDPGWIPWQNGVDRTKANSGSTFVQSKYPNATHFNINGSADSDHLGVGLCGSYPQSPSCNPTDTERSYFQIDTSGLSGTIINSARLDVWEYITADWNCSAKYGVDLYLVDRPINSSTNWNNKPQPIGGPIDSAQVGGAGRAGCYDNVDVTYWNITSTIASWAPGQAWLTFGLQASDESNAYAFKRFDYNASLTVTYDRTPNTPTNPYAYPTPHTVYPGQYTQGCGGSNWGWLSAGSDLSGAVTLNATVSSPVQGQLYSWSHIWDYSIAGAPDVAGDYSPLVSNGSNAPYTVPSNVIKDGHVYGYSIMAADGLVGFSAATPVCRFGVDLTPPTLAVPGVYDQLPEGALATQFPPSGNGQTTSLRTWQTGTVPITANDPTPAGGSPSGVTCARWSWDPQLTGAAWQCGPAMPNGGIPVTPGRWGTNILYIQVQDNAGNVSPVAQYAFYVPWNPDGPPPVFGDVTGDGAPDILAADQAGNLRIYSVPGNPNAKSPAIALAATPAESPTGNDWGKNIQFTHRGAFTGGKNVDDLVAHAAGDANLRIYGNPGNTGYTGRFDSYSELSTKPVCVPPPNDAVYCNGYAPTWANTLKVAALGDPAHTDLDYKLQFKNLTGLLTVESTNSGTDGALWFFPSFGAQTLGTPVRLAATGWKDTDLISPGDWAQQGHPGLWTRNRISGELRAYTFATGTTPVTLDGEPWPDTSGNLTYVPTVTGIATDVWIGNVSATTWSALGSDGDLVGNGSPTLWGRNEDGRIQIWWGHRTGDASNPGFAWDVGPEKVADTSVSPSWWNLDGKTNHIVDSSLTNALTPSGSPARAPDHNNVADLATAFGGGSYYRTSSGPGIDTSRSYSVAAWVKLNNTSGYQTFASLTGNQRSPFYLQYSPAVGSWAFVSPGEDYANTGAYYHAADPNAPQLGVWTHLVGVYNAGTDIGSDSANGGTGTMTLYVNGQAVGSGKNPTPWTTDGALTIGAAATRQLPTDSSINGAISDVRMYPYALTDQQANNLATANSSVQVHSTLAPGKCLDDLGGGGADATVGIWDCWNGANQHFTFTTGNALTIFGKCIGTAGNGTGVVLRDCNPAEGGQRWIRRYDGSIYNPQADRCLELPGWATANGTAAGIWDCHGSPNQRWFLRAQS